MNPDLFKLYKYILKFGFTVDSVTQTDNTYHIRLGKWLPPSYEPNRYVDFTVILRPNP